MAHRTKFMGLGNPNITAAFQRLCGIKSLRRDGGAEESVRSSEHAVNGTVSNGYADADHRKAGCPTSIKPLSNGYDSLLKTAGNNGHSNEIRKRIVLEANNHNSLVGEDALENHKLYENGHNVELTNLSSANKKSNGTSHLSTSQEQSNQDGKVLANGHTNQSTSEKVVHQDYSIDNTLLYYIFSFGASLGNEVFYIIFFSYTLWNFDNFVTRKMLLFWCIVMYIGQAAKDVIRWPRPDSPPAVCLETRYELEYGMPSTHAMVGVAIPFGMLYFMQDRYEFNLILGILFCVSWMILVSCSRLYLGMHSALDIIAGLLFAFLLMAMVQPFVDYLDHFLMSHQYAVPCLIMVGITLCLLYPPLDKWSTARGDTTLSVAVFSGIYAGLWSTKNLLDLTPVADTPPFVLNFFDLNTLSMSLVRQGLGVILLVALLLGIKMVLLKVFCKIFRFDPEDPESKKHLVIELPYRYVSYFTVSWYTTFILPILFTYLNIHRPGYYSELFLDSYSKP